MVRNADRGMVTLAVVLLLAAAAPAAWVGDCGTVVLSFAPDSVVAVTRLAAAREPQELDLYALLTDVPAVREGDRPLDWVQGVELKLAATGGDVRIVDKAFPYHMLDLGRGPAECRAAASPGWRITRGRTELVHWRVLVPAGTGRVEFRLADGGAPSLGRHPELKDYPARVVWALGSGDTRVVEMATACDVPAVLNPAPGEAVPERHCGGRDWRDVGRLQPAAPDTAR